MQPRQKSTIAPSPPTRTMVERVFDYMETQARKIPTHVKPVEIHAQKSA